jgi:uncharacterized protein
MLEWDENKRLINLERHRLDLIELRFVTIGLIRSKFFALVWTERGNATRLVSFRRARVGEERAHRARFG